MTGSQPKARAADAVTALARWRDRNHAHAVWIADGAPRLTEAEHVRRFGESYNAPRSRKASK